MSLTPSSADPELMFGSAPNLLWLDDDSPLKTLFATWRAQAVHGLRANVRGLARTAGAMRRPAAGDQAHPKKACTCFGLRARMN